jgi:hypothetical protein
MEDFWKTYGESTDKETAGGSRTVGEIDVSLGFKVYTGDVPQSETFFPIQDATSAEQRKHALAKANALRERLGIVGNRNKAQYGIQITRFRDSTVRMTDSGLEPVTWKDDLRENTDAFRSVTKMGRDGKVTLYNRATKEKARVPVDAVPGGKMSFDIVVDSLNSVGVGGSLPWRGYATLAWTDDPEAVYFGEDGMWESDGEGNPRFPQVAYLIDTFDSVEAARTAIGAGGDTEIRVSIAGQATLSAKAQKEGWDMAGWKDHWETTAKSVYDEAIASGTPMPLAKKQVAEANLVDVTDVETMLAQHIEF